MPQATTWVIEHFRLTFSATLYMCFAQVKLKFRPSVDYNMGES